MCQKSLCCFQCIDWLSNDKKLPRKAAWCKSRLLSSEQAGLPKADPTQSCRSPSGGGSCPHRMPQSMGTHQRPEVLSLHQMQVATYELFSESQRVGYKTSCLGWWGQLNSTFTINSAVGKWRKQLLRGLQKWMTFRTGVRHLLPNGRCAVNAGSPLSSFLSPVRMPSGWGGLGPCW